MTQRRRRIVESLAARGRPENWATEEEAAALCGLSVNEFKKKLIEWEPKGFPPRMAFNGKRSIPNILAFLGLPTNDPAASPEGPADESTLEKFGERPNPTGRRLAS